jgi:hypothetical protein
MKPSSIPYPSASKGDFREPPPLSKSKLSSGCELHRSLKAMVQAQPFFGYDNKDPFDHLREFEKMCSCHSRHNPRHDTRNSYVEIVSLLPQRGGKAMVH